jgi:hypothetical protein
VRAYLLVAAYCVPMIGAFYLFRNDDANRLLLILALSVFAVVAGLPGSNGIYDRLLMSALPFTGIYFYRCYLQNFSKALHLPVLLLIFATGAERLYAPTVEQAGPMFFLAYGHALDPVMGVVKMLSAL